MLSYSRISGRALRESRKQRFYENREQKIESTSLDPVFAWVISFLRLFAQYTCKRGRERDPRRGLLVQILLKGHSITRRQFLTMSFKSDDVRGFWYEWLGLDLEFEAFCQLHQTFLFLFGFKLSLVIFPYVSLSFWWKNFAEKTVLDRLTRDGIGRVCENKEPI